MEGGLTGNTTALFSTFDEHETAISTIDISFNFATPIDMSASRTHTNHRSSVLAALRRSSKKVRSPAVLVKTEANDYADFIWALATKFTNTPEEAQAAVREMQTDIARCAEKVPSAISTEAVLVEHIAWRRLLSFLQ